MEASKKIAYGKREHIFHNLGTLKKNTQEHHAKSVATFNETAVQRFMCSYVTIIFGHLLFYRNTFYEYTRSLETNSEGSWLFYSLNLCDFDLF